MGNIEMGKILEGLSNIGEVNIFEEDAGGKVWTIDEIKALIKKSDKAVLNAITRIYTFQTAEEKNAKHTKDYNGKGFSSFDSEFLSSLAEQIKAGKSLSDKQMAIARNKMVKYAKQLTAFANSGQKEMKGKKVIAAVRSFQNADGTVAGGPMINKPTVAAIGKVGALDI